MARRDTIFISIASYRDKELKPTIEDCLKQAQYPDRLVFTICWQHSKEDKWDNLDEYKNDSCLLYTSPSPRDVEESRMPSSA